MRIYLIKHRNHKVTWGNMVILQEFEPPLPLSFFLRKQAAAWIKAQNEHSDLYEIVPFESKEK